MRATISKEADICSLQTIISKQVKKSLSRLRSVDNDEDMDFEDIQDMEDFPDDDYLDKMEAMAQQGAPVQVGYMVSYYH